MFDPRIRMAHILKPTIGNKQPTNYLFFDTESRDSFGGRNKNLQRHRFWFGQAISVIMDRGEIRTVRKHYLPTIDSFWALLKSRLADSHPLYVFAHNLTYDLTMIDFWERHEREKYEMTYSVLENPPMFLALQHKLGQVRILDTFNYWKVSVADMGQSLGMEKLEMPKTTKLTPEWKRYCLRDVEIICNMVTRLVSYLNKEDMGTLKISAPGIAFSAFRRKFMECEIFIHDRVRAMKLERLCYMGGLVNNFFIGKPPAKKVYHYDVNSLYPAMMMRYLPTKIVDHQRNPELKQVLRDTVKWGACAHVMIDCHNRTYPMRLDKKLCDVRGSYDTYLCGAELKQALARGDVKQVMEISYYEMNVILAKYVKYFWELRQTAKAANDQVLDTFAKLLLNSLYGRFAMRSHQWIDYSAKALIQYYAMNNLQCPDKYLTNGYSPMVDAFRHEWFAEGLEEPIVLRYLSGNIQMRIPVGDHRESFCAIAAFVTSYARNHLRGLMDIAGSHEVYYCDTDSLFVSEHGHKRLEAAGEVDRSKLGKLKLEGISNQVIFYGPKDYEFGDMVKRKGIRKNAVCLHDSTFLQDQFEGLKSVLNRGGQPYIDIMKQQKTLSRRITKGVLTKSGWVEPITLRYRAPGVSVSA